MFQPLSILDLEIYFKANRDLQRIAESRIHIPYYTIHSNILKNTICLFLAEVLYKTLQEEEFNESIFDYLINSFKFLDLNNEFSPNFHLVFLLNLSKHLGIYPNFNSFQENSFFDLKEGDFKLLMPYHLNHIDQNLSAIFYKLSGINIMNIDRIIISGKERKELLEVLVNYYILHHDNITKLNSYDVLKEVFN